MVREMREKTITIEEYLTDLEETITIAEKHPDNFILTASDLNERKKFVNDVKKLAQVIEKELTSEATNAKLEVCRKRMLIQSSNPTTLKKMSNGYKNPQSEFEFQNQAVINDYKNRHQKIMAQQDQDLEEISTTIENIHSIAQETNRALAEHDRLLDDLSSTIENTESQLDNVIKKVDRVIGKINGGKQTAIMIFLAVVLAGLLLVYFAF
ncbi:syntaxin-6-like [Zophobas morio]|uniref:syntaxin-6-like n=1 Tax=Zophobas morio TaxID=2755281 RepID=UPI0030829803